MHRSFLYTSLLLAVALWLSGCKEQPVQHIIFLGHPYDWNAGNRIDPRIEALDLSAYDHIWLGGDVCSETTKLPATLDYIDSLFHLRSDSTHWTWGNHDMLFGKTETIRAHTGKPDFYVQWQDGYCLLVLNTNLFWPYPSKPAQKDCEAKAAQMALIKAVTDTIREASHLVILHHHALLTEYITAADGKPADAFNGTAITMRPTCDSTSDFTKQVYPWLTAVQQRGVKVLLVGGDMGMRAKTFARQTPEGIQILGSGINNSVSPRYIPDYVLSFAPDQVLLLEYRREERTLEWRYESLHNLLQD